MTPQEAAAQLESQGYFEKARQGDRTAASYFTRLTAYTCNPNGATNYYGCLSKSSGETQVEGFSEDALVSNNNPNDQNNVWDLIAGAGAPGARLAWGGPLPRRSHNVWVKPAPLTPAQMEYLKVSGPIQKPQQTLGGSAFWLARAVAERWPQLDDNLRALKDLGCHHIRAIANVGEDIRPNPWAKAGWVYGKPGWKQGITDATNYAFDKFGLQVQWTLMGGRSATPTLSVQEQCARELVSAISPIIHKVKCIDVWNEYEGCGGVIEEMRPLARLLRSLLPANFWIGITSPTGTHAAATKESVFAEVEAIYGGDSGANFVPVHWGREPEGQNYWTNGTPIGTQLPIADNEPMGPDASVRPMYDANQLAQQFKNSKNAGEIFHQFHSAVGVWGGEIGDDYAASNPEGKQKRFTDYNNWTEIVNAFWAVAGNQPVEPPKPPVEEIDMIAIEEFMTEMQALHDFYRADEGLQRPAGIGAFDKDAIGQWLYNTYVRQREEGKSPEQARKAYQDAIRTSDEWKVKHAT